MNYTHEVIFCIVNAGFAEAVMDAAREVGARGGTVLHASGTANAEAEKNFRRNHSAGKGNRDDSGGK